jgi:hypothetical protein
MHLRSLSSFRWKCPLLFLLAAPLLSAAESAQMIVIVADSRKFHGLRAWWANLYNDNHFHFALMTIILIPTAGVILGSLADLVMSRLGINLKSRALREG